MSPPPVRTPPPSSHSFAVTIRPDRRLLDFVRLSAAALLAGGFVIALNLPLPPALRGFVALAWLAAEGRELYRWSAAAGRLRAVAFGDREIRGLFETVIWRRLVPAAGSYVGARHAWLRLCDDRGRTCCLLLCRHTLPGAAWRRLTVCWRLRR